MDPRAQTIGQLFVQLHEAGASAADLARVRDAYLLAMQLYSGLFSGSGKTTLAHEIGCGSLTHRFGGPIDLVVAGMIHGAYIVGDWGHYRLRIIGRKRDELRAVIGDNAEAYVYEYTQMRWDAETIPRMARHVGALTARERDVTFLRLVEELDRLLDYGAILCFRRAEPMKAWLRGQRDHMCRLADQLGHHALSAELAREVERTLAEKLPAEIMNLTFPGDATFRVVPRSYRSRLNLRAYQRLAGYARRIQRELRRRMSMAAPTPAHAADLRRP
jgi:(p)ppGpp synthase/HD superfamily hydrolase